MGIFLVYILKSSACLTVFYLFYKLLLSRDTFHRFNRVALLSIVILSVIIPFCEITLKESTVIQHPLMNPEAFLLVIPSIMTQAEAGQPLWLRALILAYIAGGITIFCLFSYSFHNLHKLLRRGNSSRMNGIRLIVTDQPVSPFSWMRTIVICQTDYKESGQEIMTHEMAHIKAYHSIDLLVTNICVLFHWFNPAAWLIQHELRNIHEYEADENVLRQGIDAKRYQLLLIKKAVGSQRFTSMANSFNHNSLKKRIAMMLKQKSNPWARLKYLYVLPLTAVTIVAFARPEISKELEKISSAKFSEIISIPEINRVDTTGIRPIYKPKIEAAKDTLPVAGYPTVIEPAEQGSDYTIEIQGYTQKQLEEAMAAAKVSETVAAEIAKHQPEIDKAVREAMKDAKVAELIAAEMEKARPMMEKAAKEAEKAAAAEIAKHQPEIDKAVREAEEEAARQMKIAEKQTPAQSFSMNESFKGLVFINEVESTIEELGKLNPDRIQVINVIKDKTAIDMYGERASGGVIKVTLKNEILE